MSKTYTPAEMAEHQLKGWLTGIQQERQRICNLLKEMEAVGSHPHTFDYIANEHLIALIKGEK